MFDLSHPGGGQATCFKGDSRFQLGAVSAGCGGSLISDAVTTCFCRVILQNALHFLECLSNLSKPVRQQSDAESNDDALLLLLLLLSFLK